MNFINSKKFIYDVSFYQAILRNQYGTLPPDQQKHIDFNKMKNDAGAVAVVIRAGQDYYKDAEFDVSWRNAKAAGLPRASYWFCDKDSDPEDQARLYWSIMKNDIGEGFLAGDLEWGSWLDWDSWFVFFSELQQISGLPNHKIFFYTNYWFWKQYGPQTDAQRAWFARFPLWLASYTDLDHESGVLVPRGWNEIATLWQFGTPVEGELAGAWSKEIDKNVWNDASPITFEEVFGFSPVVVNPPVEIEDRRLPYEIRMENGIYRLKGS